MNILQELTARIYENHCPELVRSDSYSDDCDEYPIQLQHVAIALGDNYHINCGTGDITRWNMHKSLIKYVVRYDLKKNFSEQDREVHIALLANIS